MISFFVNPYYIHTMLLNTLETTENYKIYYFNVYFNIIWIYTLLAKMNSYEIIVICILSCQHIEQSLISLYLWVDSCIPFVNAKMAWNHFPSKNHTFLICFTGAFSQCILKKLNWFLALLMTIEYLQHFSKLYQNEQVYF